MPKYFIDCEFLEGKQKEKFPINLFRKETPSTIDLISIGVVNEYGDEYYAISKDFNLKETWNRLDIFTDKLGQKGTIYWLRDNVLKPIFNELWMKEHTINYPEDFTYSTFKKLINKYGKTKEQIAKDLINVIGFQEKSGKWYRRLSCNAFTEITDEYKKEGINFYGYYCNYDWVAFCWLFGRMIDLLNGFPMYCNDLKQILNSKYMHQERKYSHLNRIEAWLQDVKKLPNYPKQTNTHSAIQDARWNKQLYEFLEKL